jgi:hypothetical protein
MSQLPWFLYTNLSLEQGRFLGKLEWVSMYGNANLSLEQGRFLGKLEWVSMYGNGNTRLKTSFMLKTARRDK